MGKPYAQVYQARLRAEKIGVENTLTIEEWKKIIADSGGKCCYCKKQLEPDKLELEHRIPMGQGGPNTKENVAVCCRHCNDTKGSYGPNGEKPKLRIIENYKGHYIRQAGCLVSASDEMGGAIYPYFQSLQDAKDFIDYRIVSGDEELENDKRWADLERFIRKEKREAKTAEQKKYLTKFGIVV